MSMFEGYDKEKSAGDDQAQPSGEASLSGMSGLGEQPMPDPKPIFEKFLEWALELGIVTYVMLVQMIPVLEILETLKDDEEKRDKIYSACTGLREDLVRKLVPSYEKQAENLEVAIETDDNLAQKFVLSVGIPYYIQHIALEKIYSFVMGTMWMLNSTVDAHRAYAALLCKALVEHKAFNGSSTRTHERILRAITVEKLFGDEVPAELRIRAIKALQKAGKTTGIKYLGSVIFDPEDGITFEEVSQHVDVSDMAEPFVFYATELGLAKAAEALNVSELPPALVEGEQPSDEKLVLSEPPPEVVIDVVDEDEDEKVADEEDSTREISAELAEARAKTQEASGAKDLPSAPPPLPPKHAAKR